MKIIRILLIAFGILLLIGGLIGVSQTAVTEGEIYECKSVEGLQKKAEQAMKEYQAAKETSQGQALSKNSKQAADNEILYRGKCAEAKSYYQSRFIICLLVSVFGFLLLIAGLLSFFVGRKTTT